ncbi:hypothetical protein LJR289_002443 [Pseudoduganella sp. LjRoot289]|uniref:DUF6622 family protein n=1 Tax=Pseudoduganella sp. LjRoot289 TaxID=3342314 RepID=UPI003ED08A80
MLRQILIQTPVYVWAILAFLVYRGMVASKDRLVNYPSVFIIPAVMLVLGLQSITRGFGLETLAGAAWLAGALIGAGLAYTFTGPITVDRAAGVVMQRGSWLPLTLMMAIFCCKYAVAVTVAIQPALSGEPRFAVPVCLAFGLFNGIFLGRLMRTVAAWMMSSTIARYAA